MSNGLLNALDLVGGFLLSGSSNGTALVLNATNTQQAFSILADQDETINSVRFHVAAVTGTPGANCQVHIYSDSNGAPNASLSSVTITPSTGWNSATGLSEAITKGTMYWVVFKNGHGTPASNNFSITNFAGLYQAAMNVGLTQSTYGWGIRKSTTDGTTWATGVSSSLGQPLRLGFASGRFIGTPFSSSQFSAGSTTDIYAKRAAGLRVTVPANFRGNIIGVIAPARKQGTPTGNLLVKAYKNQAYSSLPATPDATSWAIPAGNIGTTAAGHAPFIFPSALAVVPSDVVDFFLRSSNDADTSGNSYRPGEAAFDSDADSTPLIGSWTPRAIFTTDDSTTAPTALTSTVFSMALMLDSAGAYNSGGSSAGLSRARAFAGFP